MAEKALFDAMAAEYDATFTDTATGSAQRDQVYHWLEHLAIPKPNSQVLEVNCGTGADAVHFARQGHKVIATDISSGMIDLATERYGAEPNLEFEVLPLQKLSHYPTNNPFDVVFSNFGGWNCLSEMELGEMFQSLTKLLHSNGHVVAVVMGRFCFWETLYFMLKGKWKTAWRRRNREGISFRSGEMEGKIYYYSPRDLVSMAEQQFECVKVAPIGWFVPPSYLDDLFQRFPSFFRWLVKRDQALGNRQSGAYLSDHFIMVLKKKE